jgi:hypothetical protein
VWPSARLVGSQTAVATLTRDVWKDPLVLFTVCLYCTQ